jgi:mercuric ion transport protein
MQRGRVSLLSSGAVGSAVAASICCFGPLLLAVLGLGGGAFLLKLAPYRPYFLGATALFLASAFYLTYRDPAEGACRSDGVCTNARDRRGQKIILWVVATLVTLAAVFPYLMDAFH